jgi:hypothetical protein
VPHLTDLKIDMGFKKFFITDNPKQYTFLSQSLRILSIRALFESPNAVANILKQLDSSSCLFKLEIDYLGSETFTHGSISAI